MSLLSALIARLSVSGNYATAMAGRVGATRKLPALPGTVIEIVSEQRRDHFKGPQPREALVQVDILSRDEETGATLRDLALEILVPSTITGGYRFDRAQIMSIRSGGEIGTAPQPQPLAARFSADIHRESIDIIFTYRPA